MRGLILGTAAALLIVGCGGGSKTVSTPQTPTAAAPPGAGDTSGASTAPSGAESTSLDSPAVRDTFASQLRTGSHLSPVQARRVADCAIAKFKADGYRMSGAIPQDVAVQVGKDCATQIIRRR